MDTLNTPGRNTRNTERRLFNAGMPVAFTFLLLFSLAGFILSLMLIIPLGALRMDFVEQAQLYGALPGWACTSIYILFLYLYEDAAKLDIKKYRVLIYLSQAAAAGMFISLIAGGYGLFSGVFSGCFILLAYAFIYFAVKDTAALYNSTVTHKPELKFIYAGFLFLIIASFAPWGIALLNTQGLRDSYAYVQSGYLYAHFLYNGYFTFCIAGLVIRALKKERVIMDNNRLNRAFMLLFISNFPAYMLLTAGEGFPFMLNIVALAFAALQLWGAYIFVSSVSLKSEEGGVIKLISRVFMYSFLLKFIIQLIAGILLFIPPDFYSRDVQTGYLNMVLIGFITFALLYLFGKTGLSDAGGTGGKWGVRLFSGGFIFSELCLFFNGLRLLLSIPVIPYYQALLMAGALFMLAGVVIIYIRQYRAA